MNQYTLTESFGTSHDNSYWTDAQRIGDFTVDELKALLSSGEAIRCTDYWSLGQVTTDEAVALKAFSENLNAADGSAFKVLTEYPYFS